MTVNQLKIAAMAEAIVVAHAPSFGTHGGEAPAPGGEPRNGGDDGEPVYQAARQATEALGFIPIDAECLARAWQAQTARTGHFDAAAWPDHPADFGLAPWPRADAFPACPQRLGLYAVLPDAAWVGRMARTGVPTVQLRFKSDDAAAVRREVAAAVAAGPGHRKPAVHQRPLAGRRRCRCLRPAPGPGRPGRTRARRGGHAA
jgi:thiamine-phosphate pyrophosphorylase